MPTANQPTAFHLFPGRCCRFDEIVKGLSPFLKSCGYNLKTDVTFIPITAMFGANVKARSTKEECPW